MEYVNVEGPRGRNSQATVFDAVAGRVGYEGFLTEQQPSKYRDTLSTTNVPVPPDEILFRRKGAPIRYAEDDVYFRERHLRPDQALPDADLLKILHAYVADFYASAVKYDCKHSFGSLDETALLAMGILLEEAALEALGRSGDLAFAESAVDGALHHAGAYSSEIKWRRSVINNLDCPKTRAKSAMRAPASRGSQTG